MKDDIVIDGVSYRRIQPDGEQLQLVICDNRGLTFVGYCDLSGDSETITIRKARCVIYWGTKEHIAELVNGPLASTKLGKEADVVVFRRRLIAVYDVKGEWHES